MVDIDVAKAFLESANDRRKPRTEDLFMKLRASLENDAKLPMEVDEKTYQALEEVLPDAGGYEYDPSSRELIIKACQGPMHDE